MKLPFSYRHGLFGRMLLVSFAGHALFFAQGRFFGRAPQYDVNQGRASMEMVLIKEELHPEPVLEGPPVPEEKKPEEKEEKKTSEETYVPKVEGALTEAKPAYLNNPAPVYPLAARRNDWEGLVVLRVLVDRQGKAVRVLLEKSSGHDVLDQSASQAVNRWRFLPSRLGNVAFESWITIPVRFVLKDGLRIKRPKNRPPGQLFAGGTR